MSDCKMCQARTPEDLKFFEGGSQPLCSFRKGLFDDEGWNCATANAIRAICSEYDRSDLPTGVVREWYEDQNYAIIPIGEVAGEWIGAFLYVEWYKSRGRTEEMHLLGCAPRAPFESECLRIIDHYQNRALWPNGHPDDEEKEDECLKVSA